VIKPIDENYELITVFIGRFIFTFMMVAPVFILFLNILLRYLRYMEPKPVEEAAIAAIIVALF